MSRKHKINRTADVYVKAGCGVFVGVFHLSYTDVETDENPHVHFRAKTWVHDDQLGPDQKPAAIASKIEDQLINSILMPPPLRDQKKTPVHKGGDKKINKSIT
jgi:hypothetical protein